METTRKPFRVIIVGAAVSGLTLAHLLERAGIDYLVLERGKEVAFAGGASIGLQANALRIMDQLGLYEDISSTTIPIHTAYHRRPDGSAFNGSRFAHKLEQHLGYPIMFCEREELLQILFKRLPDKSKVLCSHKVVDIQTGPDCAIAVTTNGKSFQGDIVVGADGIHSFTREVIWRNLSVTEPEVVQKESSSIGCEYACVFGVSVYESDDPDLVPGTSHITYNETRSSICIVNNNKKFWFMIFKQRERSTYPNIPRFSRKDAESAIETYKWHRLTSKTCLIDLWQHHRKSAMVSLEEVAFTRWFHQRLVILGDAVHKVTPNAGHGGNTAIESATTLANLLFDAKNSTSAPLSLSYDGLQAVFKQYQLIRNDRVIKACATSSMATRLQAMDNVLLKYLGLNIMPLFGDEIEANVSSEILLGGEPAKFIAYKGRHGCTPWETWDPPALVAERIKDSSFILRGVLKLPTLLTGTAVLARQLQLLTSSELDRFPVGCELGVSFPFHDSSLAVLSTCLSLLPFGLIGAVEALRAKNVPLRSEMLLTMAVAIYGNPAEVLGCLVLFALAFTRVLSLFPESYGYTLTLAHANALVRSLVGTMAVAVLASSSIQGRTSLKTLSSCRLGLDLLAWLWLLCPVAFSLLTAQLASMFGSKRSNQMYGHEDLAELRKAYLVSAVLSAISHFASRTMLYLGLFPLETTNDTFTYSALLLVFLNCLWNLPARSRTAVGMVKFGLLTSAFAAFLGPGSTSALLWLWREDKVRCRG